jgi:ABC-type molybdenum transport system ATPase subunit/photorepair protein PhrA
MKNQKVGIMSGKFRNRLRKYDNVSDIIVSAPAEL